ncbi:hypothetical protein BJX61DRAFT_491343 [Aspergillus egyptiacus]|nr:hypothetical protein BJX61DRAFT_491343 [Aspergillus egyptiacus]
MQSFYVGSLLLCFLLSDIGSQDPRPKSSFHLKLDLSIYNLASHGLSTSLYCWASIGSLVSSDRSVMVVPFRYARALPRASVLRFWALARALYLSSSAQRLCRLSRNSGDLAIIWSSIAVKGLVQ